MRRKEQKIRELEAAKEKLKPLKEEFYKLPKKQNEELERVLSQKKTGDKDRVLEKEEVEKVKDEIRRYKEELVE